VDLAQAYDGRARVVRVEEVRVDDDDLLRRVRIGPRNLAILGDA